MLRAHHGPFPAIRRVGFFALLAVAFVALWARSYTSCDAAGVNPGGRYAFSITSYRGAVWVQCYDADLTRVQRFWVYVVIPAEAIYIHAPGNGLLGLRLFREESDVVKLSVPYWFLAASSVGVAAALAFRFPRRYTARGLLLATSIIAAMLGLAVYAV